MGQAKSRGSFDDRKQQALAKQIATRQWYIATRNKLIFELVKSIGVVVDCIALVLFIASLGYALYTDDVQPFTSLLQYMLYGYAVGRVAALVIIKLVRRT